MLNGTMAQQQLDRRIINVLVCNIMNLEMKRCENLHKLV